MSSDSGGESLAALLEAVHEIEPVIRAHTADAEASRRLPDIVADAMRQASSRERSGELCASRALSLSSSGLHDRVFRKDRLAAPERFVDRCLRGHSVVHGVVNREAEHMFGADLRPRRVEHLVRRDCRTVYALPGI